MLFLKNLLKENFGPFLHEAFGKKPFALAATAGLKAISWDEIKTIIDSRNSILRIVKNGRMVADHAPYSFEEAKKLYDSGSTLLIKNAKKSDPSLGSLAREFEQYFHSPCDVQLYCTPEGNNAFAWHYDVEEVFILQLRGSKEYTLRENSVHPLPLIESVPKDQCFENETTPHVQKVLLKQGDFLYIPSGMWHIARTESESMHASIGVMPTPALSLVNFLAKDLLSSPYWRQRLPVHLNFDSKEEEWEFLEMGLKKLGQELALHFSSKDFYQRFRQSLL